MEETVISNGLEGQYKIIDNKKLRLGYTTGSCAAAAAKAAAAMLFTGQTITYVNLMTPKGIRLHLEVLDIQKGEDYVSCAIEKDAGDDPDVTNGLWIYAKVSRKKTDDISEEACLKAEENLKTFGAQNTKVSLSPEKRRQKEKKENRIIILGGRGVGTITKPGLEQAVGQPAINRVPRQMITEEVRKLCEKYNNSDPIEIEISVPGGEAIAEKTFNPRLGILGGISILGTTGIVEPMSESALIASIRVEMNQQVRIGRKNLVVTPGNYGQQFLKENFPFQLEQAVKCSNFVGDTIDMAVELGVERMLFVSHIGKFIKVAGGIFQTHSRNADARMEILAANAILAGADTAVLQQIMQAVTTEEGIKLLAEAGCLEKTMKYIMEKIQYYLNKRSFGKVEIAAIVFSSEAGELGRTENAEGMINNWEYDKMSRTEMKS